MEEPDRSEHGKMVSRAVVPFLVVTSMAHAWAGSCTPGSEFEPPLCPLELPAIEKVVISTNAARSPAETDGSISCSAFRINEQQVRRFFAGAKTTSARDAHYTLDWSPCYAAGEIEFSDGRKGQWSIDQFRSGSLAIGGAEQIVLYCPQCRFEPFRW